MKCLDCNGDEQLVEFNDGTYICTRCLGQRVVDAEQQDEFK